MSANSVVRIETLGRDNYDTWKLQMRALLVKNDAWGYVSGGVVKPEPTATNAAEIRDWNTKDEKAKSDLILSIGANQLKLVKNCATSRELWLKLENSFQSKGPARKATLLKSLTLQKMSEGADVREHLRDFLDTVDKLSEMDVIINPDQLAIMMLYSLPSSFENFRVAIESRDELPDPETLHTKIVEEFDARKNTATSNQSQDAMFVNKRRWNKPKENSTNKEDRKKEKSFKYKCFKCHGRGHKASECPSQKVDNKESSRVSLLSIEGAIDVCQIIDDIDRSVWCLDSGCTSHICKDINLFTQINKSESSELKLASDASAEIKAKGMATIATTINGKRSDVILNETLHVPELRKNLLSVSKITNKGYKVVFDERKAAVIDQRGHTKLVAKRIGNLYFIDGVTPNSCQNAEGEAKKSKRLSASESIAQSWHRRMGHLNFCDLVRASKNGAVRGIDMKEEPKDLSCEICIQGKMTRPSFPKDSDRKTKKLEIIHTDICGPMRVTSNGGSKYIITFTDDCTRWTEVRFIKSKDQALEEFKAYKALVEKQHDTKIKAIQSDNGREYVNKEFDEYLKMQGIQRRLTTAYTPEQNGVAERKNRTLMDSARCLLLQSGLSPSFWAEAIFTANHIRNRCPTKKLDGRTPHEAWKGYAPVVSYLRDFGCKVFCLDRTPTRGKLDARSREGIFIGYAEQSKGYRIWLPASQKVEITRDVRFLENSLKDPRTSYEDFCPKDASLDRSADQKGTNNVNVELFSEPVDEGQEDLEETVEEPEEADEREEETVPARKRGRPRIIRTGLPGRPRKDYGREQVEQTEFACVAEIPVTRAISGANSSEWKDAMGSEVRSLIKSNTWKLVERPKDRRVIGSRFVLRNKYNHDGSIEKRKARLVARGFSQRPGIDFRETFAPVARMSSIRAAVVVAAQRNMKIEQLDIATAYLNGDLEEEVFMEAPEHLEDILEHITLTGQEGNSIRKAAREMLETLRSSDVVCLLNKALYGLKQAGRAWHSKLDKELRNLGAVPSSADPCIYLVGPVESRSYIIVYVDDILVMSYDDSEITRVKNHLKVKFDVKDLGNIKHCLGLEFTRSEKEISIKQRGYINDILDRFGMLDCKPVSTPLEPGLKLIGQDVETDDHRWDVPYRELIGALMYLSVGTRPDIAHAVSYLSQFSSCYTETHWKAAKRVLRYLKGTNNVGLVYSCSSNPPTMFTDADWGNCSLDRKSYTGHVFMMNGGAVSWESKKQQTVALSSTEAEYMALSEATKEALYMKRLLKELGVDLTSVVIKNDNVGAQQLAMNPVHHGRSKHIDIRHHFVRDAVKEKLVLVQHVSSDEMTADILTKGLPRGKHENCVRLLGLKSIH